MKPVDILIKARKLIEQPDQLIQGTYAMDQYNMMVSAVDSTACKFCSLGAIMRTCEDSGLYETSEVDNAPYLARRALHEVMGTVPTFNDSKSHSQVLAAWDQAIANLKDAEAQPGMLK
jgi:hypothetical protein